MVEAMTDTLKDSQEAKSPQADQQVLATRHVHYYRRVGSVYCTDIDCGNRPSSPR